MFFHRHIHLCAFLVAAMVPALAGPALAGEEARETGSGIPPFPLAPNASWTYSITGSNSGTNTFEVTESGSDGGKRTYTILKKGVGKRMRFHVVQDESGTRITAVDKRVILGIDAEMELDPSLPIFDTSIAVGKKFSAEAQGDSFVGDRPVSIQLHVIRDDTVKAGTGTYNCYKIYLTEAIGAEEPNPIYIWYNPNVGVVKFRSKKVEGLLTSLRVPGQGGPQR